MSGELLPRTDKSMLTTILEELSNKTDGDLQPEDISSVVSYPLPSTQSVGNVSQELLGLMIMMKMITYVDHMSMGQLF